MEIQIWWLTSVIIVGMCLLYTKLRDIHQAIMSCKRMAEIYHDSIIDAGKKEIN